jgi:hypothetical protein
MTRWLETDSNTDISIVAATEIGAYTANATRRVSAQAFLSSVAGGGDYVAHVTLLDSSSAVKFTGLPKTTVTAAAGETTIFFQGIDIDMLDGDILSVIVHGLAGDTAAHTLVRFFELAALSPLTADRGILVDASGNIALADGYITAAKIATGAIDADALATDAITEFWNAADRTLTSSAAATVSAVSGTTLNMTIGATYSATISGLTIPATWIKMYLTIKQHDSYTDANSILQIIDLSTPDALVDGITYLNKVAATSIIKAYGSLVVTQAAGTVAITVTDDGTTLIPQGVYRWDLKCLLADGSSQVLSAEADCNVNYTVTHTIATA